MLASIVSIVAVIGAISQAASVAVKVGKDAQPYLALLKKLLFKEQITQAELDEVMAQNDALNAEIEAQEEF